MWTSAIVFEELVDSGNRRTPTLPSLRTPPLFWGELLLSKRKSYTQNSNSHIFKLQMEWSAPRLHCKVV